jgi:acyl-CoA thioesterase FadM
VSKVRVEFIYEVVRARDNSVLATGSTVHASLDSRGRPCRMPDRVRALLAQVDAVPDRS